MEIPVTRAEPAAGADFQRLNIRFTGTGSEYFRIWIVNLLLLLVTLGLYWPWAKVRRLRYFWGNTLVDGDPLGFHGDPRQMFKGWLLVGVLFGLYNWAGSFSALAGGLAFLALAALWPALWRSSMCFRMANTSWRGLRMRFLGNVRDAYLAFLPPFLMATPFFFLAARGEEPAQATAAGWQAGVVLSTLALIGVSLPWSLWRMKAYQHRHYALGALQTDFRASLKAFYALALKPLLLILIVVLAMGVLVWAGVYAGAAGGGRSPTWLRWGPVLVLLFWGLLVYGITPWWTARLQNLVWSKTGNPQLRFVSRLSFRRLFWLSVKNGLLIVVTLGLYWPFAAVAKARLRLEAVHIRTVLDTHGLMAAGQVTATEAAGDAAGDFFGLDVGL